MVYIKRYLSVESLLKATHNCFSKEDFPKINAEYSWVNCIMSGLAIFGLKFPSLLKFDEKKDKPIIRRNLNNLYLVNHAPSDTQLRERLDLLPTKHFRKPFKIIFAMLQRSKVLEQYQYLNGHYVMSIDGTGQFESKTVHCKNCCEKKHRDGTISYYHQMLGIALVHPDKKIPIPLCPEPILKTDGSIKNDCERNASKRLLEDLRREHPHLKIIIVEDGLASNEPHLKLLESLKLQYIIGAKEGDHPLLFHTINNTPVNKFEIIQNNKIHKFRYINNTSLNTTNHKVNFIDYWEETSNKKQHFSWVTNLTITNKNILEIMRAGRSRWKIENETFNVLKNQGYNFEHNYGHGEKNLCSVLAMLMLLAFLIDQVQQLRCIIYQQIKKSMGLKSLFEMIRSIFQLFIFDNWTALYERIPKDPSG
jgi:hypothetical protein